SGSLRATGREGEIAAGVSMASGAPASGAEGSTVECGSDVWGTAGGWGSGVGSTGLVTSAMLTPGSRKSTIVCPDTTIPASSCASQLVNRTQPLLWFTNSREGVAVPWIP